MIQMYIGQEKVFTYANKVLPYSTKQQVLDAVANAVVDGAPCIRELFSTSPVPAHGNCVLSNSIWL